MSKDDIYSKLNSAMESLDFSEANVVYILSRVRKLIELTGEQDEYSVLNFYCNFALHVEIDRPPQSIVEMLTAIKEGTDYGGIIGFEDFHADFQRFLEEKGLSNAIYADDRNVQNLRFALTSIYSDTPIFIKTTGDKVKMDQHGSISFESVKLPRKKGV